MKINSEKDAATRKAQLNVNPIDILPSWDSKRFSLTPELERIHPALKVALTTM